MSKQKVEICAELANAFRMRDELIVLLTHKWHSHLMNRAEADRADFPFLVCIESPEGELYYHISEDNIELFSHLQFQPTHWDGSSTTTRTDRVARLVCEI